MHAFMMTTRPTFYGAGKASSGVARRCASSAGKILDCRIGVFATYVFTSWPCVHRSRVVCSEGMDRRSRSFVEDHVRACRHWLPDPDPELARQ